MEKYRGNIIHPSYIDDFLKGVKENPAVRIETPNVFKRVFGHSRKIYLNSDSDDTKTNQSEDELPHLAGIIRFGNLYHIVPRWVVAGSKTDTPEYKAAIESVVNLASQFESKYRGEGPKKETLFSQFKRVFAH